MRREKASHVITGGDEGRLGRGQLGGENQVSTNNRDGG